MRVLVLEDDPIRNYFFRAEMPGADLVETAEAAETLLAKNGYDVVFLDHDLGGETWVESSYRNTGSAVVRWAVQNKPKVKMFVVHTLNSIEGPHMSNDLALAGYDVIRWPFNHSFLHQQVSALKEVLKMGGVE